MSTTTEVPFFDLSDPDFSWKSEAVREARDRSWYARTNYGIAVLRYEQLGRLIRDRRLRQGSRNWPELNGVTGPWAEWWKKGLLNVEGADHTRLRKLVNPAFFPGHIKSLTPMFEELADELIDPIAQAGRCEFMADFAEPYAARVMTRILGIPEEDWRQVADWAVALGLSLDVRLKSNLPRIEEALQGLYGYADALIEERRREPRDDFMTHLLEAHEDEDRLTHDELRVNTVLLVFGAIDTTRNQLGLAMEMFLEHPDQWELLARCPEHADTAVEEVMRFNPTVTWVTREAVEDFEYEGVEIPAGTVLHLFTGVAGTDPQVIGDGGFDITASERPRQYGFGFGVHHCIGHFLARNDVSVALAALTARLADPRLDGEARFLPRSGNTGPIELPVAFRRR